MDKLKKVLSLLLCCCIMLSCAVASTFAWLRNGENTIDTIINASLVTEYFQCGSGREDDPFVITRPIHYYHMIEFFQRITALPTVYYVDDEEEEVVVNFGEDYLYFQIGCTLDKLYKGTDISYDTTDKGYYVFDYNNSGEAITNNGLPQLSNTLNMAYYSGDNALMPLGSSEVPFNGQIDGKGLTVSNLSIVTSSEIPDPADETQTISRRTADVGIFGYVGPGTEELPNTIKDVFFTDFTIDITGATADGTLSSVLENHDHTAELHDVDGTDVCYVGFIAGHISDATICDGVYINNATILGGAAAQCNFGYFGYVESADDESPISQIDETLKQMTGEGEEAGFGGSMDMKGIYTRVLDIRKNLCKTNNKYLSAKKKFVDETNNSVTYSDFVYNGNMANTNYRIYNSDTAGTYIFTTYQTDDRWNYLSGLSASQTTSVSVYAKRADPNNPKEYLYEHGIKVQYEDTYLGVSTGTTLAGVTEENALLLVPDEGYYYVKVGGEKYYLNRNGTTGITLGASATTSWDFNADNEMYTTVNGTNYYLYYENGWRITSVRTTYRLNDGEGNYLTANATNNGVANTSSPETSVKWQLSSTTGNTTVYYNVNGTTYYLNIANGALTVNTTSLTWSRDGSKLFSAVNDDNYYIVYDNGWKLTLLSGFKLSDGADHYLSGTTNAVSNSTEANAVYWHFSSEGGTTTQIYTIINRTRYYLGINNTATALTMSTNSSTWNRSENGYGYYQVLNGVNYMLKYDNGWTVVPQTYFKIHDGDHYLRVTGANTFADGSEETASKFFFSDTGTNPSGYIYTNVGTNTYRLMRNNSNGTLQTTTNTTATQWTNDGSHIYYTNNGISYVLRYNNGWGLETYVKGYYITDGNGNYLRITGTTNTAYGNTTDKSQATAFVFATTGTNPSGKVYGFYNGTKYYLRFRNNELQTTTTENNGASFSNNGSVLSVTNSGTTYYLLYKNGKWNFYDTTSDPTKYKISYNVNGTEYYMAANGTTLTATTDANAANVLLFNSNNGTISTFVNNNTYNLNTSATTADSSVSLSTSSSRSWAYSNGSLRFVRTGSNYCYLYLDGSTWKIARGNASYTDKAHVTITEYNTGITFSSSVVSTPDMPNASATQITEQPQLQSDKTTFKTSSIIQTDVNETYIVSTTDGSQILIERTGSETERAASAVPIRVNDDDDEYEGTDKYGVSAKNTGYIVGGNHETGSGRYSDIRISKYAASDISNSYTNKKITSLYTVTDSGTSVADLTDEYYMTDETYIAARDQFLNGISDGNIYGLHFMNSEISMDNIVIAKNATVLGRTYENYELPEDCIDFRTLTRGQIVFFAGTYFSKNDSFFSLHQIYRNKDNTINQILEIQTVYVNDDDENLPVIYKYKPVSANSPATYSDANGGYTSSTVLPFGYTEKFNTDWITKPIKIINNDTPDYGVYDNSIYYFSIPCNAGEFALGSVEGGTGAYLMYLDIGSNGGGITEGMVGDIGDGITNVFHVDVRSADDTLSDWSLLQLKTEVPDCDNTEFKVEVSFSEAEEDVDPDYSSGIYTVRITNLSTEAISLYVLICDDNDDPYDDLPYAYRVEYVNATHGEDSPGVITNTMKNVGYYKIAGSFEIPPTGDASDTTFS